MEMRQEFKKEKIRSGEEEGAAARARSVQILGGSAAGLGGRGVWLSGGQHPIGSCVDKCGSYGARVFVRQSDRKLQL